MVALLQDALSASLDEIIESGGELSHALAQVVETEIDTRKSVKHRWRIGSKVWLAHAAAGESGVEAGMTRGVRSRRHVVALWFNGCDVESDCALIGKGNYLMVDDGRKVKVEVIQARIMDGSVNKQIGIIGVCPASPRRCA